MNLEKYWRKAFFADSETLSSKFFQVHAILLSKSAFLLRSSSVPYKRLIMCWLLKNSGTCVHISIFGSVEFDKKCKCAVFPGNSALLFSKSSLATNSAWIIAIRLLLAALSDNCVFLKRLFAVIESKIFNFVVNRISRLILFHLAFDFWSNFLAIILQQNNIKTPF